MMKSFGGLSEEEYQAARPALLPACALAVEVWNFCGGFEPQALPLALAYFDPPDPALTLELVRAIQSKHAEREAARTAHGATGL